jgi:WD40 repeat protein
VELWNALTHECSDTWPAFEKEVTAVGLSRDGRFAAAATDNGSIKIRDIASKREISEFTVKKCIMDSLSFSPDNRYLAVSGRNSSVWLFDVSSNRLMPEFDTGMEGWLFGVTFSPDGQTLAAVSYQDHSVWLWEVSTRQVKSVLRGHRGNLWEVDFMPDGKTLATAGEDNCVKLWNLDTYQEVASMSFDGRFGWMEISPDGKTMAVGHGQYPNELKTTLWQAPSFEEIAEIEAKENAMAQKQ